MREINDIFIDPRGKSIILYKQTWEKHISVGHPEMITRYDDLKTTIEDPDHIREGRKPATEELYVKRFDFDDVLVSTRYLSDDTVTIVTTSYSGSDGSSKGIIKWCK